MYRSPREILAGIQQPASDDASGALGLRLLDPLVVEGLGLSLGPDRLVHRFAATKSVRSAARSGRSVRAIESRSSMRVCSLSRLRPYAMRRSRR
jgi:hypothetical protein